jgi:hypothetical protein
MTTVALAAIVLVLVLAERVWRMFTSRASRLDHPLVFFPVVFGLMLMLRWPEITWPHGINLDEAQMLAQAMRFCAHPVPWRDVDGTTSGPLNSWFLSVPIYFAAPPAWQTARLVLWAANCLTLVFLYLALRVLGTREEAQFVLAPTIVFYAFALDPDFAHYSSETVPVLLISAGLFVLARQWHAARSSGTGLFLLGLIVGSLPFTKLQAAPLALFLFMAGLTQLVANHRAAGAPEKKCLPAAGMLCLGAAAPGVLILGWVAARGAISDFWISYVEASGAYAQEISPAGRIQNTLGLFAPHAGVTPYFLGSLLAAAVMLAAFLKRGARPGGRLFWPLMTVLAEGVLTVVCILIAGKAFLHYLLLLVPAVALFLGLAFFAGRQCAGPGAHEESGAAPRRGRWFLPAFLLALVPQLLLPVRYVHGFASIYPRNQFTEESSIANRIRAVGRAGDTLGIWGWMPSYYVDTGLMPATRDVIGHYVVTAGPHREFFRRRYLADLEQSRPAIFVDAVCDGAFLWWNWRRADAHEGFPELAAFIDDNYTLWWTIPLTANGVPLRIYVLKARMAELHLPAGNVETFSGQNTAAQPP